MSRVPFSVCIPHEIRTQVDPSIEIGGFDLPDQLFRCVTMHHRETPVLYITGIFACQLEGVTDPHFSALKSQIKTGYSLTCQMSVNKVHILLWL